MTQANEEFGRFQAKRDELVKIGDSLLDVYEKLALTEKRDLLGKSGERLRSQGFRLLVLGEFNAGKSTLINALLGEPVLPRDATEATAIINEVKWGQPPRAVLHLKDGNTREVKIEDLESHVTVRGLGIDDSRNSLIEAPYHKAEIFYPVELCRNGVEIIDSPGLNAQELRERITLDYLSEVDAVLFVLNATQLANMSELRVIDNVIKPAGHDDIFFVANKANWLNPAEVDRVRRVAEVKLAPRTNHGMERVFFMNALGAADGRTQRDQSAVEQSGILPFERALEAFLTNDRGRTKLIHAALEFRYGLRETRSLIPDQIRMLQLEQATFDERVRAAEEPLRVLQERRKAMVSHIDLRLIDIREDAAQAAYKFIRETTALVDAWATEQKLENSVSIGLSPTKAKRQIEAVVNELTGKLNDCLHDHFVRWQMNVLNPMIEGRVSGLLEDLQDQIEQFAAEVEKVKVQLSLGTIAARPATEASPSAGERVAAAVGGWLLMDVGSAMTGATFGLKAMLRSALPQLGIVVVGFATGWGALFILPVAIAYALINMHQNRERLNRGIRAKVSEQFALQLGEQAHEQAVRIGETLYKGQSADEDSFGGVPASQVHQGLIGFRDAVDKSFRAQIDTVHEQVEAVRTERVKGGEAVSRRIVQLEELRATVDVIDARLDDILAEVATRQVARNQPPQGDLAGDPADLVAARSVACVDRQHRAAGLRNGPTAGGKAWSEIAPDLAQATSGG